MPVRHPPRKAIVAALSGDAVETLKARLAKLQAERETTMERVRIEANMMVARVESEFASRIDELQNILSILEKKDESGSSQDSPGDDSAQRDSEHSVSGS